MKRRYPRVFLGLRGVRSDDGESRVRTHEGRVGRFVARAAPADECDLGAVRVGEVDDWGLMRLEGAGM